MKYLLKLHLFLIYFFSNITQCVFILAKEIGKEVQHVLNENPVNFKRG